MKMNPKPKGKLYLIPTFLGESSIGEVMPEKVKKVIEATEYFVVENEKTARRYIKKVVPSKTIDSLTLFPLNKFTDRADLDSYLEPCLRGFDTGVISEAGCPAVADPGADVVRLAHEKDIQVVPLVGPSSILLAIMASGMNGQSFCFNGYLPVDKGERRRKIKELEALSAQKNQSQLFIETPYRNTAMLEDLISGCSSSTLLCVACDLTTPDEYIRSMEISRWKNRPLPDLNKRPTIFAIHKK